jgi:hypothetical protein
MLQDRTRHVLYLLLAAAIALPFFTGTVIPPTVGPEAKALYKAVEAVPNNKIVILSLEYEAGTLGENLPQTRALMNHLMKSGKRFAIMGFEPIGPVYGQIEADELAAKWHRPYGKYWVNWGYRTAYVQTLKAMAKDVAAAIRTDHRGVPLSKLPVMRGIHSPKDAGLVIDITPSTYYEAWMAFFTGPAKVKMAVAPTAVMVSDIFPYLDSGQMVGMLKGLAGAAQYEALVFGRTSRERGITWMTSVSMTHILIIALIILGNATEIITRRRKAVGGTA